MAIEDLKVQLQTVDVERWGFLLNAKILDIESSSDSIIARSEVEDAIEAFPALRCIADVVSESFLSKNREILETFNGETEAEQDGEESGGSQPSTENAMEYLEDIYGFGIALSCIAIKVLTEPEERYFPLRQAVPRPDLVEKALDELDEDNVTAAAEALCDKLWDEEDEPAQGEHLADEYPALIDINEGIATFTANNFGDRYAYSFASAVSYTMFAALKNVIDVETFKLQLGLE